MGTSDGLLHADPQSGTSLFNEKIHSFIVYTNKSLPEGAAATLAANRVTFDGRLFAKNTKKKKVL